MNAEEIYRAGFDAFFKRVSVWSCPFNTGKVDNIKHAYWIQGWLDAEYRCYFKYIASANYIVSDFFGEIVLK